MAIPFNPAEIVQAIGVEIREARELIGLAFIRDIVPSTPVRTGHARRNWQVNWGSPSGNELVGVDFAGGNTVTNGEGRIKTGRTRNPFMPLVIENNVPYIGELNEGSSRQAPPMFVERSLQRAVNVLKHRRFI